MSDNPFQISRTTLVGFSNLLAGLRPADDDSDDWGPAGPVVNYRLLAWLQELGYEDKLGNFEIQDLMSNYNQAETLASSVLRNRDKSSENVINKVSAPLDPQSDSWTRRTRWGNLLGRVALNPQPLPPREGPFDMAARLARTVIDQAVLQYRVSLLTSTDPDKTLDFIRALISEYVDDWCLTRPRPWPLPLDIPPRGFPPVPPPPDPLDFRTSPWAPLYIIVVGGQFQKMADYMANSPLGEVFSSAAGQLFEKGLEGLAQTTSRRG